MANNKRIVTGNDAAGRSRVIREEIQPGMESWAHTPGFSAPVVWHTAPAVTVGATAPSFAPPVSVVPGPGGTCAMLVTFPPEAPPAPDFDPVAMAAELSEKLPGLAECFEPDGSGFERTDTVDYGVVLEGEIWLELDDGSLTHLRAGDLIVQNGTRHAWRNRSNQPARLFFVLAGARRV